MPWKHRSSPPWNESQGFSEDVLSVPCAECGVRKGLHCPVNGHAIACTGMEQAFYYAHKDWADEYILNEKWKTRKLVVIIRPK